METKVQGWYQDASEADEDWRTEAIEDRDFYLGRQWTADEVAECRKKKIPYLTINKLSPLVHLVSGYQRTHRYDAKVFPKEDGDQETAQVINALVKDSLKSDHDTFTNAHTFTEGIVMGRGWLHGYIDYDKDIMGEPRICRINPLYMFYDPDSEDIDLRDANFVIRVSYLNEDELKRIWPDAHMGEGATLDPNELQLVQTSDTYDTETDSLRSSHKTKKYKVLECWYKEYEQRHFGYDINSGTIIEVRDKAQGKRLEKAIEGLVYIERNMPKMKFLVMLGTQILSEGDSPYKGVDFPYFPYFSHFLAGESFGLIRALKDPQREINKRRSQALHQVITKTRNVWGTDDPAIEEDKVLSKLLIYNSLITTRPGSKIYPLQSAPDVVDIINMERLSTDDLKGISGINADLLGMTKAETSSGRAIALRQQQGITILGGALDNFRLTLRLRSQWLVSAIQAFYTTHRTVRVLGESGEAIFHKINQPVVNVMGEYERILNDVTIGRYDVELGETPESPTMRIANFMMLMDMVTAGIQIPWEVLIEASDIPNKERIKEAVMKAQQAQGMGAQEQGAAPGKGKPTRSRTGGPIAEAKKSALRSQMAAQGVGSFRQAG